MGAFIGDSIGSLYDFKQGFFSDKRLIDFALRMPGGGPQYIAPRKITDDSDMAMCLLHAISCSNKTILEEEEDLKENTSVKVDINEICRQYVNWEETIFKCCKNSPFAEAVNQNGQSLSNGCLKRITPLAVLSVLI